MTSPVNTSVKNFNTDMVNAPVLTNGVNTLIPLLDACLIDGFDIKTADSLVVVNGVATLSFTGTHSAQTDTVILVNGSSATDLNGEQRVTFKGNGFVRFKTTIQDTTDNGTVTFKVAPAGWQKVFTDTNIAVYRSTDVTGTQTFIQVNDNNTANARVRAYENMTDALTGTGQTPLDSQINGGLFWGKGRDGDVTPKPWYLVADKKGFYFAVNLIPQSFNSFCVMYAGDFKSRKSGDAYAFVLTGNIVNHTNDGQLPNGCVGLSARSQNLGGMFITRSHTTLGGSIATGRIGKHQLGANDVAYSGGNQYTSYNYPNACSNELLTCELELTTNCIRGTFRGILHAVQFVDAEFLTGSKVQCTDTLVGRNLLSIRVGPSQSPASGTVFLDITGPWGD